MSAVGCPLEAPPTRGDTPAENFLGLRAPRHHNVTHAGRQEGVAMLPPTQGVVDDIRPGATGLAPTSSTNLSKRALRARPMVLTRYQPLGLMSPWTICTPVAVGS